MFCRAIEDVELVRQLKDPSLENKEFYNNYNFDHGQSSGENPNLPKYFLLQGFCSTALDSNSRTLTRGLWKVAGSSSCRASFCRIT